MTHATVASDPIEINAPIAVVWQILVDFDNYAYWNQFCPVARVARLAIGEPVVMRVDIGFGLSDQTEYISRIEPEAVIAWRMDNKPGDPIHAERVQTLKPLSPERCLYQSIDYFSGPGSKDMIAELGDNVRNGFNLCARNLKSWAEQRHQLQPT